MKAADTSVIVAAFASWHAQHEAARRFVDEGIRIIDHCALETYSVLTRLSPPHRSPAAIVSEFLRLRFAQPFLRLKASQYRAFVVELAGRGITGGAAYDALVAATAAAARVELVTCDRRAAAVYDAYDVPCHLLG